MLKPALLLYSHSCDDDDPDDDDTGGGDDDGVSATGSAAGDNQSRAELLLDVQLFRFFLFYHSTHTHTHTKNAQSLRNFRAKTNKVYTIFVQK